MAPSYRSVRHIFIDAAASACVCVFSFGLKSLTIYYYYYYFYFNEQNRMRHKGEGEGNIHTHQCIRFGWRIRSVVVVAIEINGLGSINYIAQERGRRAISIRPKNISTAQ